MSTIFPIVALTLGWLIDNILGEPRRFHPLVVYGNYVNAVEKHIHVAFDTKRYQGVIAVIAALLPIIPFFAIELIASESVYLLFSIVAIYVAMSYRGLCEHALAVYGALADSNLTLARSNLAKIVSRDTSTLNETEMCSACIESVLENGNDAIFAAWFWWLLAGIPGIIIYRMINTLDAMWGYKNERYLHFGWAAARLDDLANYIPARTTAFCYCLAGDWRTGWRCWHRQGKHWKSPNAGPVMAAGAGSLKLMLGGAARYHGATQHRPDLGAGKQAQAQDILLALRLLRIAMWIWLIFAACLFFFVAWLWGTL